MLKDILIRSYKFNLSYAEQLVSDVNEELMTKSGGDGLENHPVFTLGHLITASAMTSEDLGGPYDINPEWEELFRRKGPGDPRLPNSNTDLYPDKSKLLEVLTLQHNHVESLIRELNEERFGEPVEWRFAKYMPTVGDLLYFSCVTHESMHLGQLAGWRRSMGLSSALAKL